MKAKLLFTAIVVCGCSASEHKQAAQASRHELPARIGSSVRRDDDSANDVRQWLARNSYAVLWDRHASHPALMEWDQWIMEGREIPNVEYKLCVLLAQRDSNVELPQVARSLGSLGSATSVPFLVDALSSKDIHVRMQAARALGELRDERAIEPLGITLAHEPDENVRANIVVALGAIGGLSAARYLENAAEDDSTFVADIATDEMVKPPKKVQRRHDGHRSKTNH